MAKFVHNTPETLKAQRDAFCESLKEWLADGSAWIAKDELVPDMNGGLNRRITITIYQAEEPHGTAEQA